MVAHVLQGVRFPGRGAVGVTVAQQVGRYNAETPRLQRPDLVAPVVAGARESVEEEESGLGWRPVDMDEGILGTVAQPDGLAELREGRECHGDRD